MALVRKRDLLARSVELLSEAEKVQDSSFAWSKNLQGIAREYIRVAEALGDDRSLSVGVPEF